MTLATVEENKAIYTALHDEITAKRFHSPYSIRRHAHAMQYQVFLDLIPPDATVLDAGCGEGTLGILLAKQGCRVTGFDLSEPNIVAANRYAVLEGVADRVRFQLGDIEHLPVTDRSFDYVISSHVLEHIPDFTQGARELARIAIKQVIVAIPTCLNLCSMTLLGGDKYWTISRRSVYALPWGVLRVFTAFFTSQNGVNEGYEGNKQLIHISRFPWRGKTEIEAGNLRVISYCGSTYVFPYFPFLLPITKFLERMAWWPIIRNFGYGSTYICEPVAENGSLAV